MRDREREKETEREGRRERENEREREQIDCFFEIITQIIFQMKKFKMLI